MGRICCFTGHRPHRFTFAPDGLRPEQVQTALGQQIRRLYGEGYRTFISGMSAGVDLWAAAEVLALRESYPDIELIAAVPFSGQESHWAIPLQREYRRILDAAQQIEVLFDVAAAEKNAAECYRKRNRWMVDRADTVLAVCEIDVADSRTGTAATVRYARRLHKRILYIDPGSLAVTEETVQQMEFMM